MNYVVLALALSAGAPRPDSTAAPTSAASEEPDPFASGQPSAADEPLPAPSPETKRQPARVHASLDEGFGLASADDRFGLKLGILGATRASIDQLSEGGVDFRFSLPLARIMLQGHLWGDRLTWEIQPEFSGGARLLDYNATFTFHPALALKAGQFRPWFTRGFPTNLPVQALPDRGLVLDNFRIDRDLGITVMGHPWKGKLEYYLGVLNGEGLSRSAARTPMPLLTARVVGAPLGPVGYTHTTAANADDDLPFRIAFAANAAANESNDLRTRLVVGGDVALQVWRLQAMGEGFWRSGWTYDGVRTPDAWGAYGNVGIVAIRHRLEPVVRAGVMRRETDSQAFLPLEPGFNVFVAGDHLKLQFRYRCNLGSQVSVCYGQGADLHAQLWF